jgi:predicted transcriptional regulator
MANKIKRAWYIDKLLKIGIVEKATNAATKDGYTSDWKSISQAKDLRIYAISRDADLSVNSLASSWSQIPEQFHELIVYKTIAMGYKDPRNMELNNAQYFDGEYEKGLREAKKFSKNNYQSIGSIKPQDF